MWLPPFPAFPQFPSNRESQSRPKWLRSQFICPDLSQFIYLNLSRFFRSNTTLDVGFGHRDVAATILSIPKFPIEQGISGSQTPMWAQIPIYSSRFIPIFLLQQLQPFPGTAFPGHSTPRVFPSPIPAGDPCWEPLPVGTKELRISGSGLGTAPGTPESMDLGGTRAAASQIRRFFLFLPSLSDFGNDSGDRNPGLSCGMNGTIHGLIKFHGKKAGRGVGMSLPGRV